MASKVLEYARKMTKQEVDSFYGFIRGKQDEKILAAQQALEKHAGALINEYHTFEYESNIQMEQYREFLKMAHECFINQQCQCGLKLKLFTNRYNGQQFWGCPDYLNESTTHRAWNYDPREDFSHIYRDWLTNIIKKLNLRGILHTKYLLIFYEENGLKDLQFENTGKSSKELINRYTNINSNSKEFELRQVEFLRNQWPNVIYQFPVKYKYVGEKEKCCFIDILCSNDETICIYECKTSQYNIDNNQMNLYIDVIKYINNALKINKRLTIDYITEN
jgi:hypothetical protein